MLVFLKCVLLMNILWYIILQIHSLIELPTRTQWKSAHISHCYLVLNNTESVWKSWSHDTRISLPYAISPIGIKYQLWYSLWTDSFLSVFIIHHYHYHYQCKWHMGLWSHCGQSVIVLQDLLSERRHMCLFHGGVLCIYQFASIVGQSLKVGGLTEHKCILSQFWKLGGPD